MVGASYAAVPLYRRFCQATGYGGTVRRRESVEEKIARHSRDGTTTSRELVVQFNADVADGMPWKFVPTQREVRVKPGESALAFYTAENLSSTPITGVSTYNVTPMKVKYHSYFGKLMMICLLFLITSFVLIFNEVWIQFPCHYSCTVVCWAFTADHQ
ncbi:cytochrome c oxidase assembly protein COX11, mitochondrial-like [Ananas comosus]|uniref:Cytochrome c oxidase assembly protein COX11, mitochondrial-like n=1 Tax=Ananas comosus TaxID=4615 RepID=A0A6P5EDN7_ANACO|nr:cytochrome c oxidase assembly protein COX11, mitochondrial-like [Ananas comosus]